MRITYKTSLSDFSAAYRMCQKENRFLRYDQIIWPSILALGILAAAAFGRNSTARTVLDYVIIYSFALSVGLPIFRKFNAYRFYRTRKNAGQEFTTEMTADKVVDITRNECELTYEWSSITGFGQNTKITVLCMSNGHFIFFPTAILDSNQRDELNGLVTRHGIKRWS